VTRQWVVNASPLIVLTKINQVHLLSELCDEVVIPSGVVQEICIAPDNDPAKLWILNEGTSYIQDVGQVDPVIAAWGLGLGESHVFTWIYNNPGYEAILNDHAAKTAALALEIPVRGTLGVILLAKREGKVEAAKPIFEQLIQVGFRVSTQVLESALRLVGE
jgi:predicted nucleic acid-binding protein